MRKLSIFAAAACLVFGFSSGAKADSPWMTEAAAKRYAAANLGPKSNAYPVGIECRVSGGKVVLRFRTRSGTKPFNKWQFAVSPNPAEELSRVSRLYRIIATSSAGTQKCAIAYR